MRCRLLGRFALSAFAGGFTLGALASGGTARAFASGFTAFSGAAASGTASRSFDRGGIGLGAGVFSRSRASSGGDSETASNGEHRSKVGLFHVSVPLIGP